MVQLAEIGLDRLLHRLDWYGFGDNWLVLISEQQAQAEVLDDLQETVDIFVETGYFRLDVSAQTLRLSELDYPEASILTLYGFEQWDEKRWRDFNYARYHQHNNRTTILLLSREDYSKMNQFAPHFAHWIKKVFQFDPDAIYMTEAEKESCLVNLREWTGYTDQDVIRMAKNHTLPRDPEYGSWLLLLNREDLIIT